MSAYGGVQVEKTLICLLKPLTLEDTVGQSGVRPPSKTRNPAVTIE
jgi:hypothetical protein